MIRVWTCQGVKGTVLLTASASQVRVPTYNIMLRGNNRQDVFIDDEDKAKIIATISEKKNGDRFALYAYCVIDNHLHLVLREGTDPLSRSCAQGGCVAVKRTAPFPLTLLRREETERLQ